LQKRPDLIQAQPLPVFHADLQSSACGHSSPSGSSCVRNKSPLQAHPALDKTGSCGRIAYADVIDTCRHHRGS
jgi:hypothetical protein